MVVFYGGKAKSCPVLSSAEPVTADAEMRWIVAYRCAQIMQIPVIFACSIQYDPSLSQPVTSLFRQPVTIRLVKPSTVVALVKNMVDTILSRSAPDGLEKLGTHRIALTSAY